MLKSKVFHRLDLSAEFYQQFNCRNEGLKKRVGFFEIKNVRKPIVITIALNPKAFWVMSVLSTIQTTKNIRE